MKPFLFFKIFISGWPNRLAHERLSLQQMTQSHGKITQALCSAKLELEFCQVPSDTGKKNWPSWDSDFVLVEWNQMQSNHCDKDGDPALVPTAQRIQQVRLPLCWAIELRHCLPLRSLIQPIPPSFLQFVSYGWTLEEQVEAWTS